jgi:hypothetical protein
MLFKSCLNRRPALCAGSACKPVPPPTLCGQAHWSAPHHCVAPLSRTPAAATGPRCHPAPLVSRTRATSPAPRRLPLFSNPSPLRTRAANSDSHPGAAHRRASPPPLLLLPPPCGRAHADPSFSLSWPAPPSQLFSKQCWPPSRPCFAPSPLIHTRATGAARRLPGPSSP